MDLVERAGHLKPMLVEFALSPRFDRELSAAIILFTSQTKVLSVLIYDLNESGDLAAISVLGIAMLVITFAVVLAVNRIPMFGGGAGAGLRNS